MTTRKIFRGMIRQHIKGQINFERKHEGASSAAEVLEYTLKIIDADRWDVPAGHKRTTGAPPHLDRGAVARYIKKGINWCQRYPERVHPVEQLQQLLDRIDSGEFDPRPQKALTAAKKSAPSLGDPNAINTPPAGVQSRTEAYDAVTRLPAAPNSVGEVVLARIPGLYDTEPMEQW